MARWFVIASVVLAVACTGKPGSPVRVTAATPPELFQAEQLFVANCASCHGERASGTAKGPTFLDPIYRPDHHGDGAFQVAVQRGVQPHHWTFGPMPPIPNVSPENVTEITRYVRWLQQQAGIR